MFISPGEVAVREVPRPTLSGDAQAIVRPLAVSRCDLDYVIARGRAPVAGPFPLGHECVAEVLEIGDAVTTVKPHDRVIVPFQISCGACARCLKGMTGSCSSVPRMAAYGLGPVGGGDSFGGAISDALLVPFADAMLVKLPTGLTPTAAAALGDNAIDGFRTVAGALAREPGAAVLVAGGGAPSVGLYAVAAARALGASEVVYVDPSEERTRAASRLGARVIQEKCVPSLRVGRFPITVDATSRPEGLHFALSSTDAWGECTSVGVYFGDVPMPLLEMYTRGVRFTTGRVDARRDLPAALEIAAQGTFDLGGVISRVVPWKDAAEAWVEPANKLVIAR